MAIIANIASRGIFHIYPLELSWQQPIFPPEGLLTLPSGGLTVLVNEPSGRLFSFHLWSVFSHFPSRGVIIQFFLQRVS